MTHRQRQLGVRGTQLLPLLPALSACRAWIRAAHPALPAPALPGEQQAAVLLQEPAPAGRAPQQQCRPWGRVSLLWPTLYKVLTVCLGDPRVL